MRERYTPCGLVLLVTCQWKSTSVQAKSRTEQESLWIFLFVKLEGIVDILYVDRLRDRKCTEQVKGDEVCPDALKCSKCMIWSSHDVSTCRLRLDVSGRRQIFGAGEARAQSLFAGDESMRQ